MCRSVFLFAIAILGLCLAPNVTSAQITEPRITSATPDRFATLEEQLTNRLRATSNEQRAYIRFVVEQVRTGKLDAQLVVAIERYALKRNAQLPFLFFERALKVEAGKRGVNLPPVKQFASTALPN